MSGVAMTRSWIDLAAAALLLAFAALRAEGRRVRDELRFSSSPLILFLAHVATAGKGYRTAIAPAAVIAWRLLALLYLLRWAARVALGPIARWLMGRKPPQGRGSCSFSWRAPGSRPGLLPVAVREAEQHVTALRGVEFVPLAAFGISRYLLAWFLPFLGTMLRVGDAYADALTARGYVPGRARRTGLVLSWGLREWGAIVVSAGAAAWFLHGA